MLKLTTQLSNSLRFFVMFHGELENRDIYSSSSTLTKEANYTIENNHRIASTANFSWLASPNTIVDFRAGIARRYFPITFREGSNGLKGEGFCLPFLHLSLLICSIDSSFLRWRVLLSPACVSLKFRSILIASLRWVSASSILPSIE